MEGDISAGWLLDIGVSADAGLSACATDECVLNAVASVDVGPSSGSVDVEVFVRYNAVCNAAYNNVTSRGATTLQFQTPKPGKKFLTRLVSLLLSHLAIKVQPRGSSVTSTPSVCTASGRSA